jgi:hypothetical protein
MDTDVGSDYVYGLTYITYVYWVSGREFSGHRLNFDVRQLEYDEAKAIVQRYPPGANVRVYYDPRNPSDCVLEPGMQPSTMDLPVCALVLAGIGLLFLLLYSSGKGVRSVSGVKS